MKQIHILLHKDDDAWKFYCYLVSGHKYKNDTKYMWGDVAHRDWVWANNLVRLYPERYKIIEGE